MDKMTEDMNGVNRKMRLSANPAFPGSIPAELEVKGATENVKHLTQRCVWRMASTRDCSSVEDNVRSSSWVERGRCSTS